MHFHLTQNEMLFVITTLFPANTVLKWLAKGIKRLIVRTPAEAALYASYKAQAMQKRA